MRKLILLALVLLLALGGWAGYTVYQGFLPAEFEYAEVELPAKYPYARPPLSMGISVLSTGQMYSQQAFSFQGGRFDVEQLSAMDAILVRHPKGDFLIDTGFGREVDQHVETIPLLMQLLSKYDVNQPAADQLNGEDYSIEQLAGIILTHAHWDHVSGIPDFPEVPVWVPQDELDFIRSDDDHTVLIRSFESINYLIYAFDDGPYMGFPSSIDIYRDGSLVLVPIGGHTPGSVGVFITLPSGKRILMVGDIVWAREAIEIPAERPPIPRRMVDHDAARVRDAIGHLHQLHKKFPDLLIVPAHDRRVFAELAQYPDMDQ